MLGSALIDLAKEGGAVSSAFAVTWEQLPWNPQHDAPISSRRQRAAVRATYDAAVTPPIAALPVPVSAPVAAAADDARAEISRFDAELSALLPGTEIAPLAAVLLRTES